MEPYTFTDSGGGRRTVYHDGVGERFSFLYEVSHELLRVVAERDELRHRLGAAERLADETAVLVTRRVLSSRSAAADALLDFREPPRTERSDRIAALEAENTRLRTEAERERAAAIAYLQARAGESRVDAGRLGALVKTWAADILCGYHLGPQCSCGSGFNPECDWAGHKGAPTGADLPVPVPQSIVPVVQAEEGT